MECIAFPSIPGAFGVMDINKSMDWFSILDMALATSGAYIYPFRLGMPTVFQPLSESLSISSGVIWTIFFACPRETAQSENRSEEHTSELQSHHDLVCRLLLEKKKNKS